MGHCLDQLDPQTCLWQIVLTVLIDMVGPSMKVDGTIPWTWALDCNKPKKAY